MRIRLRELGLLLLGYAMIAAGVVWLFDAWGLIGTGAVIFMGSLFIDIEGW